MISDRYEAAFAVCLAAAVVGLLASFAISETRCRNVWTVPSRRA